MPSSRHEFSCSLPVATLGPSGTDAEWTALSLTPEVILHPTFRRALEQACVADCAALVACGCYSETETWVDLHFEFAGELDLVAAFVTPTKPMCIAVRRAAHLRPRRVAIYPAVRTLAQRHLPDADIMPCVSKPDAVHACAEGRADACIGSLDVAAAHGLSILKTIDTTMAWTLYARQGADLGGRR
jgi:hypothetical protein